MNNFEWKKAKKLYKEIIRSFHFSLKLHLLTSSAKVKLKFWLKVVFLENEIRCVRKAE